MIDVGTGVIDEDYRGPLGVLLFNFGTQPFTVRKGDRIAQLIIERIAHPSIETTEELEQTQRGQKGFGSTGISLDLPIKVQTAHTRNKEKALMIKMGIQTLDTHKSSTIEALLDSGACGNLIEKEFFFKNQLTTRKKPYIKRVYTLDGLETK